MSQHLVSILDVDAMNSHRDAGRMLMNSKGALFAELNAQLSAGLALEEHGIQETLVSLMDHEGLIVEERPIIAVNANAGNPHYVPDANRSTRFGYGDLLLVDFWARLPGEHSIFADFTWMAFAGSTKEISADVESVFDIVRAARDRGIEFLQERAHESNLPSGAEVDDVVREVVEVAGYGDHFVHRTGHNISTSVHGNGAHLDNYETSDTRRVLPRTCMSIEPGIYLPAFGVRSETNVLVLDGDIEVTGDLQTEIWPLL